MQPVDVFLSYNRLDHDDVDAFCAQLRARGIHAFLDRDSLTPGLPWPQALESALISARAVAVFLGPNGLGGWQQREMWFALDLQEAARKAARIYPVIPVLLKGADPAPSFLMTNTAIDLRSGESIDLLLKMLGGAAPVGLSPAQAANLRPYVGLHAFREEDSGFFFGRDTFVDRLSEALEHHRVVAAVGPSGCGKSSVVFAGLLPHLRRRRPPNRTWEIASFTPGVYPWRRLADALVPLLEPDASEVERIARGGDLERALTGRADALVSTVDRILKISGGSDRLLLIVDQFEEIFTLTPAPDRAAFLEALLQAVDGAPLSIVLTLRADFYGRALESSRTLSDFLGRATVPIGPLLPAELKQAIEAPVLKAGGRFEPGLVDLITEDVLRQPGQLPLLEYALAELWSRCSNAPPGGAVVITLNAYRESGELAGAIAQRSESLYASLNEDGQKSARRLFGRLVHLARGGEDSGDTRRRATRAEIGADEWTVAQKFAGPDYRLLVIAHDAGTDDDTVEVAHEAIIQHWTRLRQWVEEDRAAILIEQQVADARSAWTAHGRGQEYLMEGVLLTSAGEWAAQSWACLSAATSEYLIRSIVRGGGPLHVWVPRYAATADAVALALGYLASDNPADRRRGLDILRWVPESAPSPASHLVEVAVSDPVAEIRRYAVETLCGRHDEAALAAQFVREPPGQRRQLLLRALGHARNVQGTGLRALDGIPPGARRRAEWFALLDLLWLHRSAFSLVFALSSLFFSVAWDLTSRVLLIFHDVLVRVAGEYNLGGGFYELPCVLTASIGLLALLRSIIDGRPMTRNRVFRIGLLAGCASELINIVGRLFAESFNLVLAPLLGHGTSMANFMFAITDRLPAILGMGIFALAVFSVATAVPGRTVARRLVGLTFLAALTTVVLSRVLVPVALDLLGFNFSFNPPGQVIMEAINGCLLSTVAGLAALAGLRLALKICFDEHSYPAWPVPRQNSDRRDQ